MSRNYAIDFIRAVAMIIIVTCHFLSFGGVPGLSSVGHYLGGVGNFIFFSVSALLFGIAYEKKGFSAFKPEYFMKKRLARLFSSLWPFLVVVLLIYFVVGVHLSPLKIIMNFLGMGWFGKLPYIGHLWFITMIIFCYCMYVCISKFCNREFKPYIWVILLILCIIFQTLLDYINLPGTIFIILLLSLYLFLNSSRIMERIDACKWIYLVPLTIVTNALAVWAYSVSEYLGVTITHWAGYIAGTFLFTFLFKLGKKVKNGKMVLFLSLTGYEIYLVHHCLCVGPLSVINVTDYVALNYIVLWIVTIGIGCSLKFVGDRLNKLIVE